MLNIANGLKSTTAEIQVFIHQRRKSSTAVPTGSCCGPIDPVSLQSRITGSISASQSKRLKQTQQELLPPQESGLQIPEAPAMQQSTQNHATANYLPRYLL